MRPLRLRTKIEQWPLTAPFRITGYTWEHMDVLLVTLDDDGRVGRGEAAGVYYKNDKPASMLRQLEALRPRIEAGLSRDELQKMLPAGGARNALDCALWDLEAKTTGRAVWQLAGLAKPHPLLTTFACSADEPTKMAAAAKAYAQARAIKLKLTGDPEDHERVRAVREARADVWLGVDGRGFTRASLERLLPVLIEARVALIEQPFPIGQEALLDDLSSPIPVAADESVQTLSDIAGLVGRFRVVNIKLDKCGGLTEGLKMARVAHELGLATMVGNMIGTSLAMAPAYLLGQNSQVVDLDGPIFLKGDRDNPVRYDNGFIEAPAALGVIDVLGLYDYPTPPLEDAIELHLKLARRTNPRVRCAGVSLNTSRIKNDADTRAMLQGYARTLRLPVADPLRPGAELDRLITECLASP